MGRMELIELHDHRCFPALWRNLVTDALQALWGFGNSYEPIAAQLYQGMQGAAAAPGKTVEVLDLCSGGGGPWVGMTRELERRYGLSVRVRLSDKFPNLEAFRRTRGDAGLDFVAQPVDATRVPSALRGFRTIFSSFHHFEPAAARAVLRSAMEAGQGIGVFELARRERRTLLALCLAPLLVLLVTPWMRPFRWSRLLWTYVVPVVPFVVWFDGVVSCLRAYGREELEAMVAQLEAAGAGTGYRWRLGEERGGRLPVTYLIGYPEAGAGRPAISAAGG